MLLLRNTLANIVPESGKDLVFDEKDGCVQNQVKSISAVKNEVYEAKKIKTS